MSLFESTWAEMKRGRKPLTIPTGFAAASEDSDYETSATIFTRDDQDKESSTALKDCGTISAEEGNYDKAASYWARAIAIEPSNYYLHELLAQAYLNLDMLLPAVASATKAVELNPVWAEGVQTLARAQRELGELGMSLESYRNAVSLDPGNAEMLEEMKEVEELCAKLTEIRRTKLEIANASANLVEQEANLCLYHLSARVPASVRTPDVASCACSGAGTSGANSMICTHSSHNTILATSAISLTTRDYNEKADEGAMRDIS